MASAPRLSSFALASLDGESLSDRHVAARVGESKPGTTATLAVCPGCGAPERSPLMLAGLWQRGRGSFPEEYRLLTCARCGLWSKDHLPSPDRLREYYTSLAVEGSPWNYPARGPHERAVDAILDRLPRGARVLELGCWTGRLLAPHQPRLLVHGIEPNPAAAAIAQGAGVHVLGGDLAELPAATARFDCILLIDVFEHLLDPLMALRRLVGLLANGGTIVVVTGRTDCLPVRIAGPSYWYFACPDHLVFLNRRYTRWLASVLPGITARYRPVRHFEFRWRQAAFEAAWLLCWRYLSPHSPFPNSWLQRLPGSSRFDRLREPYACGMWKDHALVELCAVVV